LDTRAKRACQVYRGQSAQHFDRRQHMPITHAAFVAGGRVAPEFAAQDEDPFSTLNVTPAAWLGHAAA